MNENQVNDKKNKIVRKKSIQKALNNTKRFMITIALVLFLNQAIALITGHNIIWSGVKYILNAVDIYTEPKESVSFESDGWKSNSPGSWHIDKSAHWTGADTAEVVFTLKSIEKRTVKVEDEGIPNIILVIDTSLSMEGEKLDKVIEQSKKFVETYIGKHPSIKIAIVDFDDIGRIVLPFTNNVQTLQAAIDKLEPSGNTNYNDALKRVDDLMKTENYSNKNVSVLFLTDGIPCIDTPNEVATYKMLKEKYKSLTFNGIQYEMGTKLTQELDAISDYIRYANRDTLADVFYNLTQRTDYYEQFVITDYIKSKYFYVNDESDIETYYCGGSSIGTVKLTTEKDGSQKVVWDLGNDYMTGTCDEAIEKTTMKIKLILRDEYVNEYNKDFYPTNDSEEIISKIVDEDKITKKSNDTPVLKRIYTVTYENNPPAGCNLSAINTTQNHYMYENINRGSNVEEPTCKGYVFKGWEFVTNSVEKISQDLFVMPEHDITLRATWAKQGIIKSMTGTAGTKSTLYDIAKTDGINQNGAATYTGQVSDNFDVNNVSKESTIYYYTSGTGNNVIFANLCWQMVRTTSTKGVKLIYSGIPNNGKCDNVGAGQAIGNSSFNSPYRAPTYEGYMFNTVYTMGSGQSNLDTALWGHDVTYSNGTYTLVETKTHGADNTHHYTCSSASNKCSEVRFYYYMTDEIAYYILLNDGSNIETALEKMVGANDYNSSINNSVNITSSKIKEKVDSWYEENIDLKKDSKGNSFATYLEDAIFCNSREITALGGWSINGTLSSGNLSFNDGVEYMCPRLIDQFSQSNQKAKLTYPVGLLTYGEARRMGSALNVTGDYYWLGTPRSFQSSVDYTIARIWMVDAAGVQSNNINAGNSRGVRPVVSLKPGTTIVSGNGTINDPYVVDKKA